MGIFKRKRAEEKAFSGAPAVIDAIQNGWSAFPLLGGGSQQRIRNIYNTAQNASYGWMYSKSPAVRTVIDMIVRSIGQLDLRLYEELNEAERQPRPEHPAALSMRYPSESVTSDGLIRGMFKDFLIHDNAYALLIPAAGERISVVRIPAHMVEVQGSSMFVAENYRVWPQGAWTSAGSWGGGGSYVDFSPDQIMHWHGEHPHDPRVGLSRLDTLRDVIAEDAALAQAIIELAQNGLQAPIWISRPLDAPEMSAETVKAREEDMANRLRSRNRKPPLMAEGERLESFGTSPQDAQMMEVRRFALERVAAVYGAIGLAGLEQPRRGTDARTEFINDTLAPLCVEFTRMLDQRVLVRVYDWPDGVFEFNLDEKLMGDDRLKALTSATGRPVLVTNEARAMINRPPVPGGNELITPQNVLVGDNPRPSPQVMPIQDPNGPPQDGSHREDAPTPIGSGTGGKALQAPEDTSQGTSERLPQFHPRRSADIERQHRHIDTMQAVVQRHFTRLDHYLRDRQAKAKTAIDWQRWDHEFSQDLNGSLTQVVQAEGDVYAQKLGAPAAFDMGRVKNYVGAMAEDAAGAIHEVVRAEIKNLGLDAALARVSQHVESVGSGLGVHVTSFARKEAAKQAPDYDRRVKSWVADTARHAEFDGMTVPIGEDWPSGFAPGGVAGCKCAMTIS